MTKEYRIQYINKDGEHSYKVKANETRLHTAINKILGYNQNDPKFTFTSISVIELHRKGKTQWEGYL